MSITLLMLRKMMPSLMESLRTVRFSINAYHS